MSFLGAFLPAKAELSALPPLPPLPARPHPAEDDRASPQLSLLIPARNAADTVEHTIRTAHAALSERHRDRFEIILIPNPRPGDASDETQAVAERLCATLPELRVVPHLNPPGKGAALRTGFQAARGQWVCFTDADLPYELEFFERAEVLLNQGHDLVTGNRRLPVSQFDVPVSLLPTAYSRHRLGLLFNRVVRLLLPIPTTDTQAGIKAMSRKLADRAFSLQSCPGFFFDLEIFLTALRNDFRITEIPVILRLNSGKSTVRIIRETVLAAHWLLKISSRDRAGTYRLKEK